MGPTPGRSSPHSRLSSAFAAPSVQISVLEGEVFQLVRSKLSRTLLVEVNRRLEDTRNCSSILFIMAPLAQAVTVSLEELKNGEFWSGAGEERDHRL